MSVFRFIAGERAHHSVKTLCRVLGVSRSGFHAWQRRAPSPRALADARVLERIRRVHLQSRGTYGAPRIHAELRFDGVRVSRKRVARLMRQAGLSGLVKRRLGRTTISVPGVRCAPDLVERDFVAAAPDRLWVADISYVRTWEGWLYVAVVLDCYSRRVVGFAIGDHLRAALVVDALELAGYARQRDLPFILGSAGIGYEYRPELAPPDALLERYRADKDWAAYERDFDDCVLATVPAETVMSELIARSDSAVFALLCSEPTPERCHRRLVAERMKKMEPSLQILHLT